MTKGRSGCLPSAIRYPLLIALAMTAACAPKGEALYARAEAAMSKGDVRAAVIDLKNLVKAEPENAKARALLAEALVETGEIQAGAIELQKAKDLGAPADMVLITECRVMSANREFENVLSQCRPEAAPGASKSEMQIARGRALMGLDRAADAKVEFQAALAAAPDNLDALLGLAGATYAVDGLPAAKALMEKAPQAVKQRAGYWMAIGGMDSEAGDFAGAEKAYSTALTKVGEESENVERLMALGALADAQLRQGKVKEANATSDKLAEAAPNSPLVKQWRGQLAASSGDLDKARALLEETVAAMPDNYQARTQLGMVNLSQGNLGQAEMHFADVVANQPNNVQAQRLLAETRGRSQTPEQTLAGLRPALAQESADPSLLAMAGRLSLASGNREQGLAYLAQAAKSAGQQSPDVQLEVASGYLMAGDLDRAIELLEAMPEGKASSFQREYLLILALLRKGERDQALAATKDLLERSGKDPTVRNLMGGVYWAAGQGDAAREQFNEALKLRPNDSATLVNLARLDLAEGKSADAERNFRKVLETDPKNLLATLGIAVTSGARGDTREGEKWLQKAAADHPDSVDAQLALAQYYLSTGDFGKANSVIDEAAKKSPDDAALSNARGMALLGLKDVPGAAASFKRASEQAPDAYGYALNLARAYLIGGDLTGALDVVNGVLNKDPKFVPALALGAAASLHQGGDIEKATGYVERLRQAAPDAQGTYAVEGDLAMAQKRYRDAVSFYRKANAKGTNRVLVMAEYRAGVLAGDAQAGKVLQDWVAAHPDDTAAAIILADARQRGGDVDGAIGLYEQALAKVPGNAVLLNNLAVLYQTKGNPKALELAEQAYKAAPKSAAVQDTYGWILFLGGKTDEAARLLAEAIKGMPDAAEVQYHYAAALTKQGRTAEAIPLLKKAMSGQLPAATKADAQKLLQQLSK